MAVLSAKYSVAQNGNEPVLLTDLLKIKTVGSIVVAKNGSAAAFTVTAIEPTDSSKLDYKYVTQIYSIALVGNHAPVQLTTAKEGGSQPAYSPDGQQLAFVRTADGKPQVFLLQMAGGEPVQLTKSKYGATNPVWSPDGTHILFSSNVSLAEMLKDTALNPSKTIPAWPFEKPGFSSNEELLQNKATPNPNGTMAEIRAWLDINTADKKATVLNKLNFQNEMNLSAEMSFTHFFMVDVAKGGEAKQISSGFYSFSNAQFTPDGKQLIFSGDVDSTEHPDRSLESELFIADANGTNFRKLLSQPGKTYNGPSISHSGKWVAFVTGETNVVDIPQLAIMPLKGAEKDIIVLPFDRNKSSISWSSDDQYLYFTSPSNGGVVLNRINISTKKTETLSSFETGITAYALAGNSILSARTQVSNPSELYRTDLLYKNEQQLSKLNDWLKTKKLSYPTKQSFTNSKGMTVEYWVMKPSNYQQGKKYPLLVEIHGGPTAMWGPGEASMWHEFQYFCSKGYGIVYSNPRGSGGYGTDFLRANVNDWGNGPATDVLTSLDKTVAEGWADTSKLLITGGSYAGYLTAWIIAHDHRFKAACSQRGVYDLATFFGEGNAWRLVPNYFGGYPWEPKVKEILVRESPITYVKNITTPYIIFHGANDRRTGFIQAEMMFRSLKVLGRPVEFVVHPNGTHELTRSGDNRQRMDQMLRTYEFFERWLGN